MQQVDRTKVCWDCEADVNDQATYCPFCGTDLLNQPTRATPLFPQKKDPKFSDQTLEESLASLYKPPYSVRNRQGVGVPDERVETSYPEKGSHFERNERHTDPLREETPAEKGTILPLLFLMIGAHLLVLGLLLFFCSKKGVVTLEWKTQFWFLYLLMGFPPFYFGIKLLKNKTV